VRPREHYQALFAPLEAKYGPLDGQTRTAIVGFNAGGPVSLCTIERNQVSVTCELSLYPEQKPSTEGLRFELLSLGCFDLDTAQDLFTSLGALSMDEPLGDGHTVDVSAVSDAIQGPVRLWLFSRTTIGDRQYGIYEVRPVSDDT
jgi:hypothetical protein